MAGSDRQSCSCMVIPAPTSPGTGSRRCWHAPIRYRPDLRGYGQPSKPTDTPDHRGMSKRALARDMAELMTYFGHERFAVVGHDRGSYVAFRLALDYPKRCHTWRSSAKSRSVKRSNGPMNVSRGCGGIGSSWGA